MQKEVSVMHKKKKKKSLKHRLKKLRLLMYTTVSLTVIQTSGIFSLAKNGILHVYSNTVTNAFAPKTYVDIEINEPNGNTYYITTDRRTSNADGGSKEAYIANPGSSTIKKAVVARARIVAMIYDKDDTALGTTQEFELLGTNYKWASDGENGYYYYTEVLEPGEESDPIFTDITFKETTNIPDKGYVAVHVIVDTIEVDTTGTDEAKECNTEKIKGNWETFPSDILTEYFS